MNGSLYESSTDKDSSSYDGCCAIHSKKLMKCFIVYFTMITVCKVFFHYTLFNEIGTIAAAIHLSYLCMDLLLIAFITLSLLKMNAQYVSISIIVTVVFIIYHGLFIFAAMLALTYADTIAVEMVSWDLEIGEEMNNWLMRELHITDEISNHVAVTKAEAITLISRIILCTYPLLIMAYVVYLSAAVKCKNYFKDLNKGRNEKPSVTPCGIHPQNFC